jgi:Fe-S oxidoreductase
LAERQKAFEKFLAEKDLTHVCLKDTSSMKHAWELRKKGLGLIMARASDSKPIPFIEDSCIPLKHLADYVSFILDYCDNIGVETVLYAHASVGVLHIRPMLDLRVQEDIDKMKTIGAKALTKVKEYGGSWSGEHGDGRIRSVKLKEFFGEEVYACLEETKKLFDPEGIMNPGLIVDPLPEDQHLRYGPNYQEKEDSFFFNYRKEQSFQDVVHNCSGVGACRKTNSGTMCPSYMATMDETHSTRGRANVLRMVMSGQLGTDGLSSAEAAEVMALCVSCKACKTECPSRVDMGKLKAEVLQKKYDTKGRSLRDRSVEAAMDMAKIFSGFTARVINPAMRNILSRQALSLIGINPERKLPAYSSENIIRWDKQRKKKKGIPVYLFADSYLKYHKTGLAKKIITFLESQGFAVELLDIGCCQRPRISNGFLRKAKAQADKLAQSITGFDEKTPILVCEPSCYTSLIDDLPDLMEQSAYDTWKNYSIYSLEDFVADQLEIGRIQIEAIDASAILHAHCHHKSVNGLKSISRIMKALFGEHWEELDAGCCGMAGAFGYEKENEQVSKQMANRKLIPAIQEAEKNTQIIANGFSCSHQISDLSDRSSVHWVELIAKPE